jgi:hypothetical protein
MAEDKEDESVKKELLKFQSLSKALNGCKDITEFLETKAANDVDLDELAGFIIWAIARQQDDLSTIAQNMFFAIARFDGLRSDFGRFKDVSYRELFLQVAKNYALSETLEASGMMEIRDRRTINEPQTRSN